MTINHPKSAEEEKTSAEYAGIIPYDRDIGLESLSEQRGISSKFFYEQEGRPADPSIDLEALDSGATGFSNIAYTSDVTASGEYQLMQTMPEMVKKKLQQVNCFIYKGTGNGEKFKAWLKIIYNVTSDEELLHAIKERHPYGITIKAQDISKDFRGKFQQTFSSFNVVHDKTGKKIVRIETLDEDFMTAEGRNGSAVLEGDVCCIVQLGNTSMNFSGKEIQDMVESNRPSDFRQTVYYYATYQSCESGKERELEAAYGGKTHHQFFLNGLKALFGKEYAHLVDQYIEIETTTEISPDQKYTRVINNMKLKAGIGSLIIPSSDGKKTFTFHEHILYPLMGSTKPEDITYINTLLTNAHCYREGEEGLSLKLDRSFGFPVPYFTTKSRFHQQKGDNCVSFAELKPRGIEAEMKYLRNLTKRKNRIAHIFNPFTREGISTYLLIVMLFAVGKLLTNHVKEQEQLEQEHQNILAYKHYILTEIRDGNIENINIDSLYTIGYLPQELEKRIEEDLKSLGYVTNSTQMRELINTYRLFLEKSKKSNRAAWYASKYLENMLDPSYGDYDIEYIRKELFTMLVHDTNTQFWIKGKSYIQKEHHSTTKNDTLSGSEQ